MRSSSQSDLGTDGFYFTASIGERRISYHSIALTRKNSLFAGSDEGGENWACLASVVETCKLNGVNPEAYINDVLTRLVNGWPLDRLDELLPWLWAPPKPH